MFGRSRCHEKGQNYWSTGVSLRNGTRKDGKVKAKVVETLLQTFEDAPQLSHSDSNDGRNWTMVKIVEYSLTDVRHVGRDCVFEKFQWASFVQLKSKVEQMVESVMPSTMFIVPIAEIVRNRVDK